MYTIMAIADAPRCSLLYKEFLFKARELCQRMRNQGADSIFGKRSLLRFMKKHSACFRKYNIPFPVIADACYDKVR